MRSKSKLALPYICRLMGLRRLTRPSDCSPWRSQRISDRLLVPAEALGEPLQLVRRVFDRGVDPLVQIESDFAPQGSCELSGQLYSSRPGRPHHRRSLRQPRHDSDDLPRGRGRGGGNHRHLAVAGVARSTARAAKEAPAKDVM